MRLLRDEMRAEIEARDAAHRAEVKALAEALAASQARERQHQQEVKALHELLNGERCRVRASCKRTSRAPERKRIGVYVAAAPRLSIRVAHPLASVRATGLLASSRVVSAVPSDSISVSFREGKIVKYDRQRRPPHSRIRSHHAPQRQHSH